MSDDVYAEIILDHYRSPRNHGVVKDPSAEITEHNPLCGDTVHLSFNLQDSKIKDVKFVGQGCSISQASASILTEKIKGKSVSEVLALSEDAYVSELGIHLGPNREKCALLSLNAARKALKAKPK